MSPEAQRGVSQLLAAITTACFGLTMLWHSYRRYGFRSFFQWPQPWPAIVGLCWLSVALSLFVHSLYWLDWIDAELEGWVLIVPLWLITVTTGYGLYRLIRDEPMDDAGGE